MGINKRKLLSEGVTSFFSIPRFGDAGKIDLSRGWFSKCQWYDILTQIVNSQHQIEELNLAEAQLNDVELELFGEAISKPRRVNVSRVQARNLDWETVFRRLEKSDRLRQVDLSGNYLALIPSDLFVTTLAKLEEVELKDALITNQQLRALISRSKDTETKLSVHIICENLHQAPVQLQSAFFNLHKVYLALEDYTDLTGPRWTEVVRSVERSRVLREASLEGVGLDMSEVDPLLLSSLSRLARLRLSGVQLTPDQWSHLLSRLSSSHLGLRMVNMTSVSASLLAGSLAGLASLSLEYAALTQTQLEALLSASSLSTSLSVLKISNINLSTIPAQSLASLALSSTHLDLSYTALAPHQLDALLAATKRSAVLRELVLQGLDLSSLEDSVIAKAGVKLVRLSVKKTKLTTKQTTALLIANLGRSKLKVLDLSNVNLSGVDPDVLALSLTRLREVSLLATWLTKEQTVGLVNQVVKFTKLEYLQIQSATASLINQDMKQALMKNLKLVIF